MPGVEADRATVPAGGESVARIVHDLHGPLTVIRGLCATLARDETRPARRRTIALIDAEALRVAAGLRALGRTPDAATGRRGGPADLAILVGAAGDRFAAIAARRGARLSIRGVHRAVWIDGDPAMLERVIDNLVRNAIRHCGEGGRVELTLACRGGRAVLRVRDDGAGVRVADRERIFLAGERGGAPRGEGRGLGLAIAREIAQAHGGRLTLDAVGAGACFRLSLPLSPEADRGPWAA